MSRIHRDDILSLVGAVAATLAIPHLTKDYLLANMMGSAGRQESSGDLDFAINDRRAHLIGMADLPVFKLHAIAERARAVLPSDMVSTKAIRSGQLQTLWPVTGTLSGLVQVDFITGDPEWLKFSHWSPGLDVSPWKGVMISTMLGALAKMRLDWELYDETGMRCARVGLVYDLEKGLTRSWAYRKRVSQGASKVAADEFETKVDSAIDQLVPQRWDFGGFDVSAWEYITIVAPGEFESRFSACPRFPRLGYITCPETVLSILFGVPTKFEEVDTFEKLVARIWTVMPDRYIEARMRFLDSFTRSAGANEYKLEDVMNASVWPCY